MKHYRYIPVNDKDAQKAAFSMFSYDELQNDPEVNKEDFFGGKKQLARVTSQDHLWIIGHGNGGMGIGSHTTYYDAEPLVQLLKDDGLNPKFTAGLTIHLYACGSAAYGRKKYSIFRWFHQLDPFVKRFADALGAAGYGQVIVVGYAGFTYNANFKVYQKHDSGDQENKMTRFRDLGKARDSNGKGWYEVTYRTQVNARAAKMYGLTWELIIDKKYGLFGPKIYKILRR